MHLLVAHEQACHPTARSRDEARALAESLFARVESGEALEDLAEACSDEPFGKARRGFVRLPGDLDVPLFGDVANLEIDGPPQLVESSYGFHILRRIP